MPSSGESATRPGPRQSSSMPFTELYSVQQKLNSFPPAAIPQVRRGVRARPPPSSGQWRTEHDRRHTRTGRRGLERVVMGTSRSRRFAGALVAVMAVTFLLPLATLARSERPAAGPHGCHCPVKMACCEAGLCHGDMDEGSSSGPSWSGCRDEAPLRTALLAPSTTFDSVLLGESVPRTAEAGTLVSLLSPSAAGVLGPAPATPPPRRAIVPC